MCLKSVEFIEGVLELELMYRELNFAVAFIVGIGYKNIAIFLSY
jgi:hypothetical protein